MHVSGLASSRARAIACLFTVAGLAGCGGGGGGATTPQQGTSKQITTANGASTVNQAYSAADAIYSSGTAATSQVKAADSDSSGMRLNVAELGARRLFALAGTAAGVSTKTVSSASEACASGGSVSATIDDADNSGSFTTGDTGSFAFANCVEDGVTLDGTFSFSKVLVTGSRFTASQSVGATFVFDLRGSVQGESRAVTGDLSIQAAITNVAPFVLDISVTGASLTVTNNRYTSTLSNYSAHLVVNDTLGTYAYALSGIASGTGLPAPVTISTPTPLAGRIGTYPSSGRIQAVASDHTAARVTGTSATSVTVEVDGDGDGVFEDSKTMTWAQFVAA